MTGWNEVYEAVIATATRLKIFPMGINSVCRYSFAIDLPIQTYESLVAFAFAAILRTLFSFPREPGTFVLYFRSAR
jgi:hypothetical protein